MELYVHIPFCVRKCLYCDFLSFAADEGLKNRYTDALIKELGYYSGLLKTVSRFDTVFIGGGTPSLLNKEQTEKLLAAVSAYIGDKTEMTVECNPGTLDREKLEIYRRYGVNRLSIGLQSADDDELKRLGRIHTFNDFRSSFVNAREAGFTNINIDLMSGLPGQTAQSFEHTLRTVAEAGPEHISAYSLIVEPETPFYEMYGENGVNKDLLPSEETERDMYHMTEAVLKEYGYERYEISNYSKPGYECRHNLGYWKAEEYIGIGIGAASYVNGERYKNTDDINKYIECVMDGDFERLKALRTEVERIEGEEKIREYIILRLRLTEGIQLKDFEERFGFRITDRYADVISRNTGYGLLEEKNGRLRLTQRGMDLSNVVMVDFLE